MKPLIIFLTTITLLSCSSKITFPKLSEKIYAHNGGAKDKSTFKLSSYQQDARMKAYLLDSAIFLKGNLTDTLYVLEGYNFESATFYGRIWNKNHHLNYTYSKGICVMQNQSIFSDHQINLIAKWDTTQIKKLASSNGNYLDNNVIVNGTRCYYTSKGWNIQQIYFKYFTDSKM